MGDLTPQFQTQTLSVKQGGNGDHCYSLWDDLAGDQTYNLPVSDSQGGHFTTRPNHLYAYLAVTSSDFKVVGRLKKYDKCFLHVDVMVDTLQLPGTSGPKTGW